MVFVANHDSCWIQSQVATERETGVIDNVRQFEDEPCLQALSRPYFRIEARIRRGAYWGFGIHAGRGHFVDPAGPIYKHAHAAEFPLRMTPGTVGDADVDAIEGFSCIR